MTSAITEALNEVSVTPAWGVPFADDHNAVSIFKSTIEVRSQHSTTMSLNTRFGAFAGPRSGAVSSLNAPVPRYKPRLTSLLCAHPQL